jgi:hypothetical protein
MKREELLYKLTGTETPRFVNERENTIIDKCLEIINDLESHYMNPPSRRAFIIKQLQYIKASEDGFKGEKWNDFFVGGLHISHFKPEGIHTDEMLMDFYCEVLSWNCKKTVEEIEIEIKKQSNTQ